MQGVTDFHGWRPHSGRMPRVATGIVTPPPGRHEMALTESPCANRERYATIERMPGADLPLDSSLGRHLLSTARIIYGAAGRLPPFAERPTQPQMPWSTRPDRRAAVSTACRGYVLWVRNRAPQGAWVVTCEEQCAPSRLIYSSGPRCGSESSDRSSPLPLLGSLAVV